MPCSSSSEGDAAAASWAVPRTLVTASRSSAAPVLRARIEERNILFIRQNLKRNCYRRITSISVVCHLSRACEGARDTGLALWPHREKPFGGAGIECVSLEEMARSSRDALDCSSIVPRLVLDWCSIGARLVLDCWRTGHSPNHDEMHGLGQVGGDARDHIARVHASH